jgi:hypothetical protein
MTASERKPPLCIIGAANRGLPAQPSIDSESGG